MNRYTDEYKNTLMYRIISSSTTDELERIRDEMGESAESADAILEAATLLYYGAGDPDAPFVKLRTNFDAADFLYLLGRTTMMLLMQGESCAKNLPSLAKHNDATTIDMIHAAAVQIAFDYLYTDGDE